MNLKQFPKKLDSKTSYLRISVPENLDLALEGLIRKVLREQPKVDDIYSFAANYFETLLKIRDKIGANYTAAQLCPFHNDEDAHEMIKIAGTFSKPKSHEEISRTGRKKELRRLKPQKIVKGKIPVKQPTPDLIKKLPMTTENESKIEDANPETIEEKVEIDGEFLTSDPIKELVEKELMLEAKANGKETPNDVRRLETSKVEPEKEIKQEVQKTNKEDDEQLKAKDESEENSIKEVTSNKTNTEESNIETKNSEENIEKAEVLQTPTEEVSPDKDENVQKVESPQENQSPIQETQQTELNKEKTEKSPESPKNTPKEEQTFGKETNEENEASSVKIKAVEPSEAAKQEEKIKKLTGGQQPEREINEETKETNENKTKTAAEVLSVGFPVTDLANILNNNNEEKSLEQQSKTTKEVLEDEKSRDISQEEEKAAKLEVKEANIKSEETKHGNEEKPIIHTERRDGEEKTGKNVEEGLKTPKENTAEAESKINEKKESVKENENSQKSESPKPEEVKPTETTELKKEKHFPDEEQIKSPQTQETDKDNNQEIKEPEMETQLTEANEQKPKPAENTESKEKEAEKPSTQEEDNTESQEPKEVQPEPDQDKKTEPKELCNVVDVQNIQEKESNEKKEEDTNREELCTVVDVDNIPKEDVTEGIKTENEKEEETIPKKEEERKDLEVEDDNNNILENDEDEEKEKEEETVVEDNRKALEKEREGTSLSKEEINPDEMCTVVDIENIPKENATEGDNKEKTEIVENKTNLEESATVEDVTDISENDHKEEIIPKNEEGTNKEELQAEEIVANLPKDDKIKGNENKELGTLVDKNNKTEELNEIKGNEITSEELCTVVDIKNIPKTGETHDKEDETNPEEQSKADTRNLQETTNELIVDNIRETVEIQPPDIIEPEGVQNLEAVQPPEEFQIKTIQTHYYDTLQVPETVTKEFRVHNVAAPFDYKKPTDENVVLIENLNVSPPPENQQQHEITDSDDLLDIMTPTSGYSLNLSEISWQTISEMFLESERRYSSYEKEEVRYTTPKLDDQNKTPQEVEEVIYKTVIPTGVDAVPVPPRDMEEINAEETNSETVKEKKEEKPKGDSEGSTDSNNCDNDVPYISVEVKTVIETQILDEEEEKEGKRQHPGVEVTVEATIDIQDDVGMPQSQPDSIEEENKISNEKSQEIKSGPEELQSTGKDQERKESSSTEQTTGKEGSSGESDTTISSAPTEIKRTDSAKRNSRSLLSTQSLDLGKRNPLVKTRSLSTFRHGVTDFEVWSTIEKELEEAATKIQSKFRGYKTRKKLQRENAVQITTEESSRSTTPAEGEVKEEGQQSTGEFHDSIVLAEHPR